MNTRTLPEQLELQTIGEFSCEPPCEYKFTSMVDTFRQDHCSKTFRMLRALLNISKDTAVQRLKITPQDIKMLNDYTTGKSKKQTKFVCPKCGVIKKFEITEKDGAVTELEHIKPLMKKSAMNDVADSLVVKTPLVLIPNHPKFGDDFIHERRYPHGSQKVSQTRPS